jgi:tetratricopeptide (TPR) repeat protein
MNVENQFLRRAEVLLQQRRYDLAEDQLRQSIAAEPNDALAYSYLSICLAERESWAEATEAARRGIGLEPGGPFGHYALARVLRDRNMLKDARAAIGEAVRLAPHDPDYWGVLASIEVGEKRWRQALDAAERGLESDPEHEGCVNLRAMALTNLGDREAATAAIDATLSRNPENALTHANLGWTRLHEGRARDAMVHFREALRLNPELDWARSGIVEAMKARSFIYRIFLRYFLFMSRLRGQAQWAILVGGYIGYRVISSVSHSNPKLAPFLTPLIAAYLVFALGTIVSVPLFNLFLFASPFGRYALNDRQRWGAVAFGASLLPAIVFLVLWAASSRPGMELAALVCGLWVIPVALATLSRPGVPLAIMGAVAGVLGLGCAGICALIVGLQKLPVEGILTLYVVACVGSTWIANIVSSFGPAKKR